MRLSIKMGNLLERGKEKREITTRELLSLGYNYSNIYNYTQNGILQKIGRARYLIIVNKEEEVPQEIDYKYQETFKLFVQSIENKDDEKIFDYFYELFQTEDINLIKNNNLNLYLLNYLTIVPKNLQEFAKGINLEDLLFKEKSKKAINKIRKLIYEEEFSQALAIYEKYQEADDIEENLLVITLLEQVIEKQELIKDELRTLIHKNQIIEVINYLDKLSLRRNLSKDFKYLRKLAFDLQNMRSYQTIPLVNSIETKNIYEAIDNNNYILALNILTNFGKNVMEDDLFYLLLSKIKEEINYLNNPTFDEEELFEEEIEFLAPETKEVLKDNIYENLIMFMFSHDLKMTKELLSSYLKRIKKEEYTNLLMNLIEIDALNGDNKLTKAMEVLMNIQNDCYEFNLASYVSLFFASFAKKDMKKARLYFNIISLAPSFNQEFVLLDAFNNFLTNTVALEPIVEETEEVEQIIEEKIEETYHGFSLSFIKKVADEVIHGEDFTSICQQANLNQDQENTLALIFAQEFFRQGNFDLGNRYLNKVSKNKSAEVLKFYEEIKRKKRFYQFEESSLKLTLK